MGSYFYYLLNSLLGQVASNINTMFIFKSQLLYCRHVFVCNWFCPLSTELYAGCHFVNMLSELRCVLSVMHGLFLVLLFYSNGFSCMVSIILHCVILIVDNLFTDFLCDFSTSSSVSFYFSIFLLSLHLSSPKALLSLPQ